MKYILMILIVVLLVGCVSPQEKMGRSILNKMDSDQSLTADEYVYINTIVKNKMIADNLTETEEKVYQKVGEGILNPVKLLPDRCLFGIPFGCADMYITSSEIKLGIFEDSGEFRNIVVHTDICSGDGFIDVIKPGEQAEVVITGCNNKDRIDTNLTLTYDGGSVTGRVSGKVR
jgi:hypothetical protein